MNTLIIRKVKKSFIRLFIVVSIIAAIAWDLSTALKFEVVPGTYLYESNLAAISITPTTVAIVPSDYSGLTTPVSRTVDPSYNQIEDMVRKAIGLQGGLSGVVKEGDKVVLKVNLVEGTGSGNGGVTDVRVVKAVIKIVDEISHGKIHISVIEGTARANDDPAEAGSVWELNEYTGLLTDPYLNGIDLKLVNLNGPVTDLVEITIPENKRTATPYEGKFHVHKAEAEADVYFSIPVLKIHTTGITNALKNQIGTAPGMYYGYNKMSGRDKDGNATPSKILHGNAPPQDWTCEEIVDLSTIAGIDYIIVDAIMCLELTKSYNPDNQVRMNTIIAGNDPVAVDHVCAKLFCINPADIDHITLAERVGMGTNNEALINVVGASIESVKKEVERSGMAFGMCNRKWILSQAFSGTSISQEYISGEAGIEPEPGQDGWSQSVYFLDDNCDLLSYYNGQTNIVTYAFTYFYSPVSQEAVLSAGSDEDIYVYINGEKVLPASRKKTNDVTVQIKKGVNKLLVKSMNTIGDYYLSINILKTGTNIYGDRVPGLKYMTDTTNTSLVNPVKIKQNMLAAYPNPAINFSIIDFYIPNSSQVNLDVFDINGKLVISLVNEYLYTGQYQREWNFINKNIEPGIYICRLKTGNYVQSLKIAVK
ncbi:MAG: DUF362 domain-containing protein [Bacteroidales bacterium]|nr:DUF362 domain-containing protein [Bacteroidales bacterium]